ncbi:MAG: ABC transporter ATP-binding protein [Gammaproteobacteria bacterium]|nr:ABC transporter ATP-binding protein [Gammaproteobacteria bacterium]MDE0715008.1 ABC transporter ATP-binding protein [Gammaproteobacteria bacterium]MXY66091.1 ABC transporter ATP-binding protein [Gammaproteobacteria bacterium]MYG65690.1 ABC transporter ATP-binding protein [Gammaproteobacteria bacterium]MYH90242.1 ABC transporter ATP-binding protein [Gammaproteobacteria bacterium]
MNQQTSPIRAENVGKTVPVASGSLRILQDIDLKVEAAETLAIVGASGSGKSTLLGLLAGLDRPSEGRIRLAGYDITTLDEDSRASIRAGRVGFVFQSFQLLPNLTALENVSLPLEITGADDAGPRATEILERVGLGERVTHYPLQLSGGEQQRVAIARAFVTRPDILFADEPTGNLDTENGRRVADLLFALNAEHGTTLVLVTHDAELAGRCGRCVNMEAGRLYSS